MRCARNIIASLSFITSFVSPHALDYPTDRVASSDTLNDTSCSIDIAKDLLMRKRFLPAVVIGIDANTSAGNNQAAAVFGEFWAPPH